MTQSSEKTDTIKQFFSKLILIVFGLQVILALVQIFVWKTPVDNRFGTLSSHYLFPIGLIYLGYCYYKFRLSLKFILAVIFLTIMFGAAEVKSGLLGIVPYLLFLLFVIDKKNLSKKTISIGIISIVIYLTLINVVPKITDQSPSYFIRPNYLSEGQMYAIEGKSYGRLRTYFEAYNLLSKTPFTMAFGYGPGSASSTFSTKYDGYLRNSAKLVASLYVNASELLVELGLLGFVLFYYFIYLLIKKGLKRYSTKSALYFMACSCFFAFVFSSSFNLSWKMELYSYLFWSYLGLSYNRNLNE